MACVNILYHEKLMIARLNVSRLAPLGFSHRHFHLKHILFLPCWEVSQINIQPHFYAKKSLLLLQFFSYHMHRTVENEIAFGTPKFSQDFLSTREGGNKGTVTCKKSIFVSRVSKATPTMRYIFLKTGGWSRKLISPNSAYHII